MPNRHPIRAVLAKIGLDGHDRGVKVVARGLRDAGFHVIYSGLWQPIEAVVRTVAEEDAGFLGVSLLSGTHLSLAPKLVEAFRSAGLSHVKLVLGGIIPEADIPKLLALGVSRVFGPGAALPEIVEFFTAEAKTPGQVDAELIERFRQRDRLALARLLSLAALPDTKARVRELLAEADLPGRKSPVIAFTGAGGVGKSTLIGRLLEHVRRQGKSVAVLACDPQSPLTGGALLGDRVRMPSHASDDGVFIRSTVAASGGQGVAEDIDLMTSLCSQFGFDVVLLETAGIGQGDTAVRKAADVVVMLVQPESGDELQWEKAGVLEIADVVVVNKADLPGAERTLGQLTSTLHLPGSRAIPVLQASGSKGSGLDNLWREVGRILAERNGTDS